MAEIEERATYRYTAEEQREIDGLRRKYVPEASEDNLERMREIDRRVTRRATLQAVLIGIAGSLVFGLGLAVVVRMNLMLPGIVVGCVGIAVMAAMPSLYGTLLKRERKKAAPRIQELLDKTRD